MIALFIGRFQPFHLGHMWAVDQILKDFKRLKIAVGSSQESQTKMNPCSFEERKQMIKLALAEKGIKARIYAVPDIFDDERWVSHVEEVVGDFDCVYTGSCLTERLFREKGYLVKILPRYKEINATEIRLMIEKNQDITKLVPFPVNRFLYSKASLNLEKKPLS